MEAPNPRRPTHQRQPEASSAARAAMKGTGAPEVAAKASNTGICPADPAKRLKAPTRGSQNPGPTASTKPRSPHPTRPDQTRHHEPHREPCRPHGEVAAGRRPKEDARHTHHPPPWSPLAGQHRTACAERRRGCSRTLPCAGAPLPKHGSQPAEPRACEASRPHQRNQDQAKNPSPHRDWGGLGGCMA